MRQEPPPGSAHFLENRRRADSWNNVLIQLAADIIPQCADAPVQHLRPTGPLPPVRRCKALNLPWPTFVRGRRGGSAWPGGLRFGWRGYSEHRMLLVAGLPLYCTAPRQQRKYALLTRGIASQHSFRTTGFQPCPPLTAVPRWRVGWSGSLSFPAAGVDPHDLTICQIVPISEAAGELRRLRRPITLASGPHRRHPTPPMPRGRPPPVVSMGARNQSRRGQLPVAGPSQLSNVGYGSLSSRLATAWARRSATSSTDWPQHWQS